MEANELSAEGDSCLPPLFAENKQRRLSHPQPVVESPKQSPDTSRNNRVGVHIVREGDNLAAVETAEAAFGEHVLVEKFVPGRELTYGQSITDACLGFEETEALLHRLANAVQGPWCSTSTRSDRS